MIYAIEAVGTEFIKLGRAKSVGKRLRELECSSPHELNILAVADWPDAAEKAVHLYLQPMRVRGEWFKDGRLTREVVAWMLNGQAGLERLEVEIPSLKRGRKFKPIPESTIIRRAQRKAWWQEKERNGEPVQP